MHIIFIPYGIRQNVEHLLRDMEAEKFPLKMYAPDGKEYVQWIQGNLRCLPFGFYEYVVPKECADVVMTTLNFHKSEGDRYALGSVREFFMRMMTKAEPIPEFKSTAMLKWVKDNVEIIPVGVRYDVDCIIPDGNFKGFKIEAI